MIQYKNNIGEWEEEKSYSGWRTVTITKLPYMGTGTKWKYYLISSTILKSLNIIRATRDQKFNCKILKLEGLE